MSHPRLCRRCIDGAGGWKEVAKQIIVFPEELRGAAEGSVLTDPRVQLPTAE